MFVPDPFEVLKSIQARTLKKSANSCIAYKILRKQFQFLQQVTVINFMIAEEIAENLSTDMQKEGLCGRTLTLKLKTAAFEVRLILYHQITSFKWITLAR